MLLARRSEQIQKGLKSGKWLKVDIIAIKGPMAIISAGSTTFQANISKQNKETFGYCGSSGIPDSRERTGVPVLWPLCKGRADVWEMFSDNSSLSAILDRQGRLVAAPTDLRTKKTENFTPQLLQGFWCKLKRKNPKIVVISPTIAKKSHKQKRGSLSSVFGQQALLCTSTVW